MDAVLNLLSYVGWVLLAIMILVFVHELGHFLLAKLFGMRVDKFSIGFPPKVIGRRIGETEYVVGLTPLGGYVKIAGMVDESMDTDFAGTEAQPWEFRAKPVWQRTLVIVAGVAFNMLLAAVVFVSLKAVYGEAYVPNVGPVLVEDGSVAHRMGLRTGDRIVLVNGEPLSEDGGLWNLEQTLLANPLTVTVQRGGEQVLLTGPSDLFTQLGRAQGDFGIAYEPTLIGEVGESTPAAEAGLRRGDRIVGMAGDSLAWWHELSERVNAHDGSPLAVRFVRADSADAPAGAVPLYRTADGAAYDVTVTPARVGDRWQIGVLPYIEIREYGFLEAIPAGVADTWVNTRVIVTSLKRVFTGQENFRENVGGPIMIAKVTKEAADQGAPFFWRIVAMLSITLAIINILPIPALDGGHLVFLLYEGITRKEPSMRVRMALQQVGMVLLLGFMTFVIFNDILKL
jgi:regulator of sigma E protease